MYLDELVEGVYVESTEIECKAILDRENITGWLKTIAGFANASGGIIYIGVEDRTNKLIGFERGDADSERNFLNNQINEHLIPRPEMKISFLPYIVRKKERYIICVSIESSAVKPVVLKYKGIPAIYMRRDGFTGGATYEEIIEMSLKSSKTQYDVLKSDIQYDQEKLHTLKAFYSEHNNGANLTDKALRSMGFYDENGYLMNGAVLFTDNYDGEKTAVQCSVFSGTNRGSERIVTVNRFSGNLIATLDYMLEFVNQRMNHSIRKLSDTRENLDAYPRRALFEGIINAVAHRDYYLDGTQIQIDMFLDRLEITSPGGFYRGERIKKTYDLSRVISKRRNTLVSDVLVACNVMEAAGTGFDKIIEEYKDANDRHRPYICSSSDHFTLVLPDLTFEAGVRDSGLPSVTHPPISHGSKHDDEILSFCYNHSQTSKTISEHLGISDSSYLRKSILNNLVKEKYLGKDVSSNTTYYRTNRDMVGVEN